MNKLQPWVNLLARIILGATLFAAGWIKLFNSFEAKASVRAYDLLPVFFIGQGRCGKVYVYRPRHEISV